MSVKLSSIVWLVGVLLCNVLKAQLPQPVQGPCGETATIAGVVNTYYPALNNVNPGDLIISLGPPIGAASPLVQGDRVLIIQMQDATINTANDATYGGNGTDGNGYTDLGYSGQYEFGEVRSFAAGVLTLMNPLQYSYRAVSGIPNRKSSYQVVRVPTYQHLTLNGTVTAAPWDGSAGGIVSFHAWQTLSMNGQAISVTGQGFRPGRINSAGGAYNLQDYVRLTFGSFGEKGEGIAGTPEGSWAATAGGYENGSFSRGAPANAGGGGNAHNSGGGGGANFGDGGKGGYQYSGPQDVGGRGGKGVKTAIPGRIIMGGGGGGGHQNNQAASGGGHGGGIIIITAGMILGTGSFSADGISAGPSQDDGAGGGGAGGTIVLAYNGALPAGNSFSAKGGNGGNETFLARHGCGGGAGGGVIITSTPAALMDVSAGIRGLSNGTEWGAVDGEPGATMSLDLSPLFPTSTLLPILEVNPDTTVCAPTTIDLTSAAVITNRDQGPQYVLSYWTDPANTIPVANPQAVSQSGTYYIQLANTGTKCETVRSIQVTVNPQPVLTLRVTDTAVCAPTTIDLSNPAFIGNRDQGPEYVLSYWMDAATTIPIANPQAIDQSGTYYIKLTNSTTGCAVIAAVQVSIHPTPALTVGVSDTAVCAPATIDLTSPAIITQRDQGAQYALTFWMDPAFTIPVPDPRAVSQSGTYYIRLANTGTGCGTVAAIQVMINPQPVLTLKVTDTTVCAPATIDLSDPVFIGNRDQGAQYVLSYWMDAATTIPVANPQAIDQSGTYYIKLTNATTGCAVIAAVQVSIHPTPLLTVAVSDTAVCAPATIDLTSPAIITQRDQGAQYELTFWMDPAYTIPVPDPRAVSQSGTYYIRLANTGTGCGTVAAIQVMINPQPVLTLKVTDTTVCASATIDLSDPVFIGNRDQGPEYVLSYWTDAATTIPVANPQAIDQSGTYYIKLTNSTTGCAVIAAVQVSIHPTPLLTVVVSDTVLCAPATIDLTSAAIITQRDQGAQYALTFWMDPAFTIPVPDPRAVNQSGTYYIRLANTGTGCGTVAAIQVAVHPQPVLTLTATSPSCNGADNGSIIPTPSNGTAPYQYSSDGGLSWQDTIGNHLSAGTYSILTRDSYGCISQAVPAVLTDPPLLMLWEEVSAHANVPCHGASEGQLLFTAAGGANGYQYTISSTATGDISNNSGLFTGLPAGDYTVIVTDASQCSRQITTAILEPPPLSIALVSKTDLDCENQPRGSISLTAKGGQPPYWFRIGESGWQRDSLFTGLLAGTYLLTVRDGNECVTAPLSTEILLEEGCDVVFPSAFTPNGDGLNDLFRPKYYSRVSDYRLTVYNRWGAIIFQSNDAAQGWNGQFKGVLMDTGTYVWVATFVNRRGQPQTMKGTITLVK